MVTATGASAAAVVQPPAAASLADSPAAMSSIAAYISAGERTLAVMDVTWGLCMAAGVLVAAAWAFGILPGAVRLF